MHRNINRIQKLLASILLIFISFGNYFAFIQQTSGYETSIYISTPIEVWLSLSISLIAGTLIIIQQVHSRQYKRSNFWMIALLIVILNPHYMYSDPTSILYPGLQLHPAVAASFFHQ